MEFLYLLEKLRTPFLDDVMYAITQLGDETAFLVIAVILYWCIDKRAGYYVMSVGFLGVLANQFMKLYFRIPRPWVIDENFQIVERAREGASGYSFPSGHTQSSVGNFAGIALIAKKRWIRIVAIALAVLVPFSRMYLGVHTPLDVSVAAVTALALVFILKPMIFREDDKGILILIPVAIFMAIANLLFVEFYPFPVDVDPANLASGTKNAYLLFGALVGMLTVYIVESKWIQFPVNARLWVQVVKVILGVVLILAVRLTLKAPLNALCGESVGTAIRYFLMVVTAGIVWPLSFKWFSGIGSRK